MKSLNKAMLIGNLGADPECSAVGEGTRMAKFSVATNESWTDKYGAKQEKTEWHDVVAFGKVAEIVERYVKKGDRIYVEGEINYREYEGKYYTSIKARDVVMLGGGEAPKPVMSRPPMDTSDLPF